MNDASPRLGRAFWIGVVLGGGVLVYGIAGALAEADRTKPAALARWVLSGLLLHDLVLAPLVGVAGVLVARATPRLARAPVQAALIASAVVLTVASPALLGLSDRPGNPTIHPIDYGTATTTVLAVVWALAGSWIAFRWWRLVRARAVTIAIIAKAPRPGQAKTRLCPPCTPEEAAGIARAALEDTVAAVAATPTAGRRVVVLDGPAGPWLPPEFDVVPQRDGSLGDRLDAAFSDLGGPTIVVAMDTPQVTPELLGEAARVLQRSDTDAVLGLTEDGGYWAIGLREPDRRVFDGVPMSSPRTGRAQLARLGELGLTISLLPELRDVDDFDDAVSVARAAPDSGFAAALEEVAARLSA